MKYVDVFNQKALDNLIEEANPDVMPVVRFGTKNNPAMTCGNATVEACNNATVEAYNNATVEAYGNASVRACNNASVRARGNASVEACDNATVEACGNTQVLSRTTGVVKTHGNSRIIYDPRTIAEYCDHYGIECGDTVKLYKAVHKDSDGVYHSDNNYYFTYDIGTYAIADDLTVDVSKQCGHGIHMAHLDWCLEYGSGWSDLAILELEADANSIIVPKYCDGKVRTDKVKVLREIPLDECGTYGKILAKNMKK